MGLTMIGLAFALALVVGRLAMEPPRRGCGDPLRVESAEVVEP